MSKAYTRRYDENCQFDNFSSAIKIIYVIELTRQRKRALWRVFSSPPDRNNRPADKEIRIQGQGIDCVRKPHQATGASHCTQRCSLERHDSFKVANQRPLGFLKLSRRFNVRLFNRFHHLLRFCDRQLPNKGFAFGRLISVCTSRISHRVQLFRIRHRRSRRLGQACRSSSSRESVCLRILTCIIAAAFAGHVLRQAFRQPTRRTLARAQAIQSPNASIRAGASWPAPTFSEQQFQRLQFNLSPRVAPVAQPDNPVACDKIRRRRVNHDFKRRGFIQAAAKLFPIAQANPFASLPEFAARFRLRAGRCLAPKLARKWVARQACLGTHRFQRAGVASVALRIKKWQASPSPRTLEAMRTQARKVKS